MTLCLSMEEDLGTDDLEALFFAANPVLTSAQKDVFTSLFQKIGAAATV